MCEGNNLLPTTHTTQRINYRQKIKLLEGSIREHLHFTGVREDFKSRKQKGLTVDKLDSLEHKNFYLSKDSFKKVKCKSEERQ